MANLAVIGAGIGGCSAAYFARKYLPGVNVTIYDSQNRIGGRILTHNTAGAPLEIGAAFFNRFNKTLLNIIKAERLKVKSIEEHKDFAVWNGSEFVFRSNKQAFVNSLKVLAKYKLSLSRAFLLLQKAKGQIAKLYKEELENPADMGELFESTCIDEWYKKTFVEALIERGISQAFIDEIVTPVTRVIYSQNSDLGGFAGISSLVGVYSGATYSLAGGNSTLPGHLVKESNANIKLGHKVDMIEKESEGTYRVYTGEDMSVFDSIIVATPLELSEIRFDGLSMQSWKPNSYKTVYRQVMRGVFDPNYFGLKDTADPPAIVLTTKDAGPITNYSIQKASNGESLITISSPEPLNNNVFNNIFKNGKVPILEHCWKAAYPVFKPLTNLPPTSIDKRLIYASAIESAVSSMETSALSAFNAVRMLGGQ